MNAEPEPERDPLVLVVDPDEGVLRLLSIKLTRAGFSVVTACDGRQALALALARVPALVVTEKDLPSLDGFGLARALGRAPGQRRPALVFLATLDGEEDLHRAFRSGCDDFITKPFSPGELVHRLKVTLLRHRLTSEMAESTLLRSALS
jgi:DNA-binding response OmpR family regulator